MSSENKEKKWKGNTVRGSKRVRERDKDKKDRHLNRETVTDTIDL